ncbi:pilus assembly protein TadG-related protein [Bradyrhizobium elkanii]|uniref:pilus assembly protein TadG-related protein n=1 Tax=Bradyrhizobium elkanii TaxID=29448 RepID=UPI0004B3069A|nr:pilus assembly protein TadG-related protein [Bradyrhizobium elkanii]WLA79971.1 pilus assembly protein TadG-related protein [Bradyrhizobium elkanii]
MHNMLRCRRGSAAFATVVALVPLIGFMALGAEGGSWYVTKQRAQNAADAAAYSGGLWLACSLSPSICPADTQSMDYRGKQFAAQNAFCNAGDGTAYPGRRCTSLPSGTSQAVTIAAVGADSVRATVTQTQPAYLAKVLGLSTVTIGATATAQVKILANPCVLTLSDPLAFQGSTTVQAQKCGLSSNSTQSNSLNFTGNGLDVSKAGAISGQGDCHDNGGGQCSKAITFAPPVPDPLSGLNTLMSALKTSSFTGSSCNTTAQPTAYDATHKCYNDVGNGANKFNFGNTTYNLNGVYFFNGNVTIGGSTVITGTATIILMPGSSLTINGNPIIKLTALSTVTTAQVPAALASVVGLMSNLLIYDPEKTTGNQSVKISGSSDSFFTGITYLPNADVVYQGSTVSATCVEVIAKGVTLSGNSNFDNSGCAASSKIVSQYVRLVQ